MKQYRVYWEIDVENENINSPEEAAQYVWKTYFQTEPDRIANVFTVKDKKSKAIVAIDLWEDMPNAGIK